jgi:hypothetical protein
MQQDIGASEAEAIDRGEAPQWVVVARRMDEMEVRLDLMRERLERILCDLDAP